MILDIYIVGVAQMVKDTFIHSLGCSVAFGAVSLFSNEEIASCWRCTVRVKISFQAMDNGLLSVSSP